MIKAVPYEAWHSEKIVFKDEALEGADVRTKFSETLANPSVYALSFVSIRNEVLAILAAVPINHRAVTVVTVMSPLVHKYKVSVHKEMLRQLEELHERGYERIQSLVDPRNKAAVKHNVHLGFELEGTLKKIGPNGEDQHVFARIR